MPFIVDDAWLPAILTASPMTDEEFAAFCAEHPDLFFEMTAQGEIIVIPPNLSLTGAQNAEIGRQLTAWAFEDDTGIAADSSTGFLLPNEARRSPDASWTLRSRLRSLPPQSFNGYWRLAPDFVIELRSQSDRLPVLRAKMQEWIENGAQLAWLVDPERRAVEIYRPGRESEILTDPPLVSAEGASEGFTLQLLRVWDPVRL